MKRFATLLLALVMILSLAATASAASITIQPNVPNDGNDTTETYKAYKIFDATFEGDTLGEDGNVAYTIDSNSPFYSVIQNFTVDVNGTATRVFDLAQINDSTTYVVTKNQEYKAVDLAAKLKDVITDEINPAATTNTQNQDGNYVLNVENKGYYLVTSSLGSALILDTLSDITVETKNTYPSLTKKIVNGDERVDTITADYGNTITFEITVSIPATAVGAITVHDTLDEDMTYVGLAEGAVVTKNETACGTEGCNVEFTISADTVAANLGKNVVFQYTATLNANVATATEHTNTAWLTYSQFTSVKDTVNVYTYKLDVFKYTKNGETETGLAGAGFVLKNAEGKYYKNTDGIVTWVDGIENATEYKTTDGNYTVTFAGIANGTYHLVEKTIPAGYNGVDDIDVVINNADLVGNAQINVLNQSGSELPETGGMGTTMFYLVGGIMVLAAVVLLVTKKRMTAV